jgi:hypothetical protein
MLVGGLCRAKGFRYMRERKEEGDRERAKGKR